MSNINLNDEIKIRNTSWNIIKPSNQTQFFLNLLRESYRSQYDDHVLIEQIFSKEINIPKLIDFSVYNLIDDTEWRLNLIRLKVLSRLLEIDKNMIKKIDINNLLENPNYEIQVAVLNMLAENSIKISVETIGAKLNHHNKEVRAAAIRNIMQLEKLSCKVYGFFWIHNINNFPSIVPDGLKFESLVDQIKINEKNIKPALEYAEKNNIPILIHCGQVSRELSRPSYVGEIANNHKDINFIIGHSGS